VVARATCSISMVDGGDDDRLLPRCTVAPCLGRVRWDAAALYVPYVPLNTGVSVATCLDQLSQNIRMIYTSQALARIHSLGLTL
jgi:hypothetical protein